MEHLRHTAAWFPSRVEIAGRRLMPPTLGQWRLLECCDSPFAAGGSASREETALALAILSRPWRAGMRMLRSEWRKALALAPWRLPPPSASRELAAWLLECWWAPERYVEDGAAPSPEAFAPCAPGAVRLAARAVRENWLAFVPVPCETVWDAPIPHLMLAVVAFSENDGGEFEAPGEAELVAVAHPGPVVAGRAVDGVGDAGMVAPKPPVGEPEEERRERDGQDGHQRGVLADPQDLSSC